MIDSDGPAEETPRRYRNPPIEHRFRKGVSGTPRGRPRKIPALVSTKIGGQPGIGFEDRIKSLAIEEAYRIITIREGDRVERIPVIQAILRKFAVAAANGNTRAQQNYLTILIGAETDRRVATMELLKAAVDYKEHWHHVLAERARTGTTGPEPVPHPDGVLIDYKTGISGSMAWSWRTKSRRGISCAPCGQTSKRVDGNQRADRVRSEQFKPAQATERVDEDRELRPRRRTEA